MEAVFILIVAGVTSVGIVILGATGFRLSTSGLWLAFGKTCECVGLTLVFFLLNLAVGMFAVLTGRWLIGGFISLYIVSDTTLLMLSLLQALTFQAWRESSPHLRSSQPEGSGLSHREP